MTRSKDRERTHRGAGRLDMLLQDEDGTARYEVELQLGASDEAHIIRTIEYWDLERAHIPQLRVVLGWMLRGEHRCTGFWNGLLLDGSLIRLLRRLASEIASSPALHAERLQR